MNPSVKNNIDKNNIDMNGINSIYSEAVSIYLRIYHNKAAWLLSYQEHAAFSLYL